jgi:hypothetical protein
MKDRAGIYKTNLSGEAAYRSLLRKPSAGFATRVSLSKAAVKSAGEPLYMKRIWKN